MIPAEVPLALLALGALVAVVVLARLLREDTSRCGCGADTRSRCGDPVDDRDRVVIVIVPHCAAAGLCVVVMAAPAPTTT
ncbi:hypothetical protein ABIA39_003468 [Nocardia sp. GAS34]|uniref:hypothetical protein n=1 Tax=unclassified Nocardia TaxID=2637762 RepID=UPI003D23DB16